MIPELTIYRYPTLENGNPVDAIILMNGKKYRTIPRVITEFEKRDRFLNPKCTHVLFLRRGGNNRFFETPTFIHTTSEYKVESVESIFNTAGNQFDFVFSKIIN